MEKNLMYKNDLNSYCQRTNTPLPVYNTTFACTVSVSGKTFTSSSTFTNRKSAEQDAAKLALQHLLNEDASRTTSTNLRLYLRKLVCQDKARCKMILNEFIHKIKMECVYETVQVGKSHVFVSSLALNGTCYKGGCGGKNKKEAEQLAALAAILSLLDDPTYATQICEVIKSKFSACAVFNALKDCSVTTTSDEFKATTSNGFDVMPPLTQQALSIGESSCRVLVDEEKPTSVELDGNSIGEEQKDKHVLVDSLAQLESEVNKTSLPQTEKQGVLYDAQCVAGSGHLPGAVTISRCSYVPLPITSPLVSEQPQHEIKLPEAAMQLPFNQIGVPTELVLVPPAAAANGQGRKKKKKANKRLPRTPPLYSEPQHEIKFLQQIGVQTEFVLPVPTAAHNPCNDSVSSKKRQRKNKNKANKRLRAAENMLQAALIFILKLNLGWILRT